MGSRATDKLKEIEELRSGIERKLGEIEQRFPLAGFGRKAAAMLAGGSAGGTVLAFAVRRLRGGKRRAKAAKQAAVQPPVVTVNVLPKGATWIAAAGLAMWAGARLYEATRSRSGATSEKPPLMIKPVPPSRQQTGS